MSSAQLTGGVEQIASFRDDRALRALGGAGHAADELCGGAGHQGGILYHGLRASWASGFIVRHGASGARARSFVKIVTAEGKGVFGMN